ncbi:MAG: signal peptidase II [Chitinivibrionia bacterium]|nr:signal peptidase II [Chitinivibrionia bacterium]
MEQKTDVQKIILFVFITVSLAAFDFTTKQIIVSTMKTGDVLWLFENVFGLYLLYNTGALFSFNPSQYVPFVTNAHLFLTFTVLALFLMSFFMLKLDLAKQKLLFCALTFISAGAIGNGLDRIIRPNSAVVDFFLVDLGFRLGPIPFDPWPIFNFADVFVNIGIGLFILDSILNGKKEIVLKND